MNEWLSGNEIFRSKSRRAKKKYRRHIYDMLMIIFFEHDTKLGRKSHLGTAITEGETMGGLFGVVSKTDCVADLYYGTDYHSHLGTRRGGMAVSNRTASSAPFTTSKTAISAPSSSPNWPVSRRRASA